MTSSSRQIDFHIGHLLDTISKALALSRSSVPEQVQRAGLRLAREVQEERAQPPGRIERRNGREGCDDCQPDMGWGAVRGGVVPFAASIRLGRMG